MFRKLHLLYFLFFANYTISQVSNPDFYREDQFYFSIYYNSIKNGINELIENKFSSSLNFGFIRDFPLNKSGKFSLGLGAGLGINSLNNNLRLDEIFFLSMIILKRFKRINITTLKFNFH